MIVIKHFGKAPNGKLKFYNESLFNEAVKAIGDDEFELTIKKKAKRVTQDQRGFYRAGVIGTAMEFEMFGGWERDDIHNLFAGMFLKTEVSRFLPDAEGHVERFEIAKIMST